MSAPSGPPIRAEKSRTRSRSSGQAQVLPMTRPRTSSGRRPARPRPIGPPHAYPNTTIPVSPSRSTSASTTASASAAGSRSRAPRATGRSPGSPGRCSGTVPRSPRITSRQPNDQLGLPLSSRSGGPVALVDVVDEVAVDLGPAVLERVEPVRDPGRPRWRRRRRPRFQFTVPGGLHGPALPWPGGIGPKPLAAGSPHDSEPGGASVESRLATTTS